MKRTVNLPPDHTLPSSVRLMSDVEAAWVGAMIDGEGWIFPSALFYGIGVANTDPEIISGLLRATGVGLVVPASADKRRTKVCYEWRASRKLDAIDVAKNCAIYSTKCQRLLALSTRTIGDNWYECHK